VNLRLAALYRYPVKGLSAQRLERVEIATGSAIAGDRRHAIAWDTAPATEACGHWQPKSALLALHKLPALAAFACRMDEQGRLTLQAPGHPPVAGNPCVPTERAALEDCIHILTGPLAHARPRLLTAAQCPFSDTPEPLVSIVSLASLADLERIVGGKLDVRRFRANLVLDGGLPWQELDWVGAGLRCGDVRLQVLEPIPRCAAIQVDPRTARVEGDLLRPLARMRGDAIFGVYARVVAGGTLAQGDEIEAPAGGGGRRRLPLE
jgi:uncharacterized protein YcbX